MLGSSYKEFLKSSIFQYPKPSALQHEVNASYKRHWYLGTYTCWDLAYCCHKDFVWAVRKASSAMTSNDCGSPYILTKIECRKTPMKTKTESNGNMWSVLSIFSARRENSTQPTYSSKSCYVSTYKCFSISIRYIWMGNIIRTVVFR
jgi:hypothetical protein